MRVHVKFLLFATLRDKYGVPEVSVECDGSLRGCVEEAARILGGDFVEEVFEGDDYRRDRIILVNGRHIQFVQSTQLKDGDVVAVFPPIAGG